MRLEDKVVLISGVGPGMGSAIALLFAQEGARVALVARKAVVIDFIAREIRERNQRSGHCHSSRRSRKITNGRCGGANH